MRKIKTLLFAFICILSTYACNSTDAETQPKNDYPIQSIPFTEVSFTDNFWPPPN